MRHQLGPRTSGGLGACSVEERSLTSTRTSSQTCSGLTNRPDAALLEARAPTPPKPCSAFHQPYRRSLAPRSTNNHTARGFSFFFFSLGVCVLGGCTPQSKRKPTKRTKTKTIEFCDSGKEKNACWQMPQAGEENKGLINVEVWAIVGIQT